MVNFLRFLLILFFSVFSFCFNIQNNQSTKRFLQMGLNDYELAKEYYEFKTKKQINTMFFENSLDKSELTDDDYIEFAKNYEKNYRIFTGNWFRIKDHNEKNKYKLEINKFADTVDFNSNELPDDLMKCTKDFEIPPKPWFKHIIYKVQNFFSNHPKEIDWRKKKILTEVKNQKSCGSCWAFSSTSALEAFLRKNKLKVGRLSEQELVDCSKENYGCNGGLMDLAFDYCIENGGLHSDENYPYNARDNPCMKNCQIEERKCSDSDKVKGSGDFSYKYTIPYSIKSLKESVLQTPVSIALNADSPAFRFYSEGVVEDLGEMRDQINHAVLLVGYSYDEKGMYWIIQNSWGKDWGDNGFIKIRSKEGSGILSCQIYGVYPVEKIKEDEIEEVKEDEIEEEKLTKN